MLRFQTVPRELLAELAIIAERSDAMSAVCDACALGVIYGKRAVRRKNRKAKK
ncbi:MAG: hypothetical protein IJZ69_04310 [Bacteroidales bacterium]|nr:hypothetical protein [Bacteroidales bacterium]MBQ8809537.1 hypothetical protein [Bacteroidales bacterium]